MSPVIYYIYSFGEERREKKQMLGTNFPSVHVCIIQYIYSSASLLYIPGSLANVTFPRKWLKICETDGVQHTGIVAGSITRTSQVIGSR